MGESERVVSAAFHAAMRHAPALIFIDEFDALFPKRASAPGKVGSWPAVSFSQPHAA